MMNSSLKREILNDGKFVFMGNKASARYSEVDDPMHKHNLYIEALPPLIGDKEAVLRLRAEPAYLESERELPPERRLHCVQRITNFVQPMPLHIDLHQKFSRVIRGGYIARNPIEAEHVRQMRTAFPKMNWDADDYSRPVIRSSISGFSIIGTSGVGKTTAVERVLTLYPQLIVHNEYNGHSFDRYQLVWLKLECPINSSVKALCFNFFQSIDMILGTDYYRKFSKSRRTTEELLPDMALLASSLGLGVLVIDEIQRLNTGKSGGGQEMLNFFVKLANQIGVPVILVGTFKAMGVLSREFSQLRRGAGQGDVVWSNQNNDAQWDLFTRRLWKYQFTNTPTPLTDHLKDILYEESQGITDIAVKLYMLAQWSVIGQDNETITATLLRETAKECLKTVKPVLDALRNNDQETLTRLGDMVPLSQDVMDQFMEHSRERVIIDGRLNTLQNQVTAEKLEPEENQDEELLVIQVAMWLINAGIDEDMAKEAARKALNQNGGKTDLKVAMWDAFNIAREMKEKQSTEKAIVNHKPKKSNRNDPYTETDLRRLVQEGYNKGIPPHEALMKSGIIKSAMEFIAG